MAQAGQVVAAEQTTDRAAGVLPCAHDDANGPSVALCVVKENFERSVKLFKLLKCGLMLEVGDEAGESGSWPKLLIFFQSQV